MSKKRLAIFASGTGSNAVNIIDYFKDHNQIEVAFVLTNKGEAPVIDGSKKRDVATLVYSNEEVANGDFLVSVCEQFNIDYIILAGYLRLIPKELIHVYSHRIINIHPALLPKFGGKGMYGDKVHIAVLQSYDKVSGISIHYIDENFDEGPLIAQMHCEVNEVDDLDTLKQKVHILELMYYPVVIEKTVLPLSV